jgi:hypothetical protein
MMSQEFLISDIKRLIDVLGSDFSVDLSALDFASLVDLHASYLAFNAKRKLRLKKQLREQHAKSLASSKTVRR